MKSIITTLVAATLVFLSVGCETTKTKASRQTAEVTLKRLGEYKSAQESQLKELNSRYQTQSSALVEQTKKLMTKNIELELDSEALQMADKLLEKWETEIQPSRLQQTFQLSARSDYEKVRALEATADDLNEKYNRGYVKVKGQVDALSKIMQNLESLRRTKADEKKEAEVKSLLYRAGN